MLPPQCGVTTPNLSSVFVTARHFDIMIPSRGGRVYISLFLAVTRTFVTPTYLERANGMGRGAVYPNYLIPRCEQTADVCLVSNPQLYPHNESRMNSDSCADRACVDSAALFCLWSLTSHSTFPAAPSFNFMYVFYLCFHFF